MHDACEARDFEEPSRVDIGSWFQVCLVTGEFEMMSFFCCLGFKYPQLDSQSCS